MTGEHRGEPGDIRDVLAPLIGMGFREEVTEDVNVSANRLAILSRGPLMVKLVRDRLQWFIEIARESESAEWFDYRMVLGLASISLERVCA